MKFLEKFWFQILFSMEYLEEFEMERLEKIPMKILDEFSVELLKISGGTPR